MPKTFDLASKRCLPCEGGIFPLPAGAVSEYLRELPGWEMVEDAKKIRKTYKFRRFTEGIAFVNRIAEVAEEEGHHPNLHVYYRKVIVELTTHAIGGLSLNDFIMAAKIDALPQL